jgi:glutaminyl-peptide cyclotransferase
LHRINKERLKINNIIICFVITITVFSCKPENKSKKESNVFKNHQTVVLINHTLVGQTPHDVGAFTEGFLFHEGKLYESTGSPEELKMTRSLIGQVDLKSGKIEVKAEIDRNKFFGEGIVFLNNKLFQLTYKNQMCFIYDAKTFKPIGNFKFVNAEGWGMTTDGKSLIVSDGSDKIFYWNPDNYKVEKTLNITANGRPQDHINELEMINGYIYANIWLTSQIAKIDPATGAIIGVLDLEPLINEARNKNPKSGEMNGIAFNPANGLVYVTGKFWPFIYQIDFNK